MPLHSFTEPVLAMTLVRYAAALFTLLLSACATAQSSENQAAEAHTVSAPTSRLESSAAVIRVTGIGTAPYSNHLTPSQRKLLALRAARLDAFRALAEQLKGMRLVGESSVANMIIRGDSFRTHVDTYLQGVHIISSTLHPDGTAEVQAEWRASAFAETSTTTEAASYVGGETEKATKSSIAQLQHEPPATAQNKESVTAAEPVVCKECGTSGLTGNYYISF